MMMVPKPKYHKHKPKVKKIRMQDKKECIVCGRQRGLQKHHIYGGVGRREISERYGMVVWLCLEHHTGQSGVHNDRNLDLYVKRLGQRNFEKIYSRKKFVETFGRNYLGMEGAEKNER